MAPRYVFICHAARDRQAAAEIVAGLEEAGVACWIAPRDVPPGADYAQAIMAGIAGSDALVLVFSAHANESPHVVREVERAVSRGVRIMPVRLSDDPPSASLEYFISSANWLDALSGDVAPVVARLVDTLGPAAGAEPEAEGRRACGEALGRIVATYGPGVADEPRRVEALLRDMAGAHRAEVAALSVAAAEGVGPALTTSSQGLTASLVERLTRQLRENRALADDAARWAVETWARVLGVAGPAVTPVEPGEPSTMAVVAAPPHPPEKAPDGQAEPEPEIPAGEEPAEAEAAVDAGLVGGVEPVGDAEPVVEAEPQPSTIAAPEPEPVPPPHPTPPPPPLTERPQPEAQPPESPKRSSRRKWLYAGGGAVAVLIAIGVVGSLVGEEEPTRTSTTTSTTAATSTSSNTTTTTTAITTTVPTTLGAFLFEERFDDDAGGWNSPDNSNEFGSWDWIVANGRLELSAEVQEGSRLYWNTKLVDPPDAYVASVEVTAAASDLASCGLTIRTADGPRLHFLIDVSDRQPRVAFSTGPGEAASTLVEREFMTSVDPGGTNRIDVYVDGDRVAFDVNGDRFSEFRNDDIAGLDRIGPGASVPAGPFQTCTYDDFVVQPIDAIPPAPGGTTTATTGAGDVVPPPTGTIVFEERFGPDSTRWSVDSQTNDFGTWTWTLGSDSLFLDAETVLEGSRNYWNTDEVGPPARYVASIEVAAPGSDLVSCGLTIRTTGGALRHFLLDPADGEARVTGSLDAATNSSVIEPRVFVPAVAADGFNTLDVYVDGSDVVFVVNGTRAADFTDSTISSLDWLGPAANVPRGPPQTCEYDNLVVRESSGLP